MNRRLIAPLVISALTIGADAHAAPRVDRPERAPGNANADRLVTGNTSHRRSTVDGGIAGDGIFVELRPIDPIDGNNSSYNGNCTISGNMITCATGPQRIWFELRYGGFGPDTLETWQVAIDDASFDSGAGAPLAPPVEPCPASSPASTPECLAAYGPGSTCAAPGPSCDFAFVDRNRPVSSGLELVTVTGPPFPIRFGGTIGPFQSPMQDPGGNIYGGNLVLEAQADSAGTYTIEFLQDATTFFVLGSGETGQIATFGSAVVEIPIGKCCLHLDQCIDGLTEPECTAEPGESIWVEGEACDGSPCGPATGACCDIIHPDPISAEGVCTDGVIQSQCRGDGLIWLEGTRCASVECEAVFQPIPTTTEWGLVVLALVLLVAAKLWYGPISPSRVNS